MLAPTIITTAPTNQSLDKDVNKSKPKLPLTKKSSREALGAGLAGRTSTGSANTDSSAGTSHVSFEEPGRLSTSSTRHRNQHNLDREARLSESSRSDRSSGDRGSAASDVPQPQKRNLLSFKKNRGSVLFPLSTKFLPQRSTNSLDDRSPTPADGSTGRNSIDPDAQPQDQLSPLSSPTQSTSRLPSPQGSSRPRLFRKDSAASARSAHSASSPKSPTGRRGRSSTLNSIVNHRIDDRQLDSSPRAASGRTSTSITPRISLGDLLHFGHRSRQGSEPPPSGRESASPRPVGTPDRNGSSAVSQDLISYPPREEDDTPATYLEKLQKSVHRGAIATILSTSDEEFYKVALRKYMRTFAFFGEPIDMSIRKLLMEAELPKETQQIDRVLQSFADRYFECNPGIFTDTDQTHYIVFSIMILHTDVFNKNNKRKMQKQDYVKNTRVEGISEDILEYFYENISYTPFIHVEDEINLNGRHMSRAKRGLLKAASSDHLTRLSREPVDPYAVILEGNLDSLRPSLKDVMNLEDPYKLIGVDGAQDLEALHQAFTKTAILQIVSHRSRPDAFMTQASIDNPAESHPGLVDIKVVKVGLLWRKDPRKRRARSPWQEWGALLTPSQLYFFRDVGWTKGLMHQYESQRKKDARLPVVFTPPVTEFTPDAIISMSNAVALIDTMYRKHKHAFLFVCQSTQEEVFLANSDSEMKDWIAKLNYAATFSTSGVPLKGTVGTRYEGQRHQNSNVGTSDGPEHSERDDGRAEPHDVIDPRLAAEMSVARKQLMAQKVGEANNKLASRQKQLDDLLRNARHLQLLTPVHPRARENVILAAGRMAAQLKWVRLDIWRTRCYRGFLSLDLGLEDQKQQNRNSLARSSSPHSTFRTATSDLGRPSSATAESVESLSTALEHHDDSDAKEPSSPRPPPSPGLLSLRSSPSNSRRTSLSLSVRSSPAIPDSQLNGDTADGSTYDGQSPETERQPSLLSTNSRPPVSVSDDGEGQVQQDAGPSDVRPDDKMAEKTEGAHRGRHRISLQRSLRDTHRHRSRKGRESASSHSQSSETGPPEGEGLSRKDTKFTFHGRRASVVTFGSEWQDMSAEERLRSRRPGASEPSETNESVRSQSVHSVRPHSLRSTSTTTAKSSRADSSGIPDALPAVPDALSEAEGVPTDAQEDHNGGGLTDPQRGSPEQAVGA